MDREARMSGSAVWRVPNGAAIRHVFDMSSSSVSAGISVSDWSATQAFVFETPEQLEHLASEAALAAAKFRQAIAIRDASPRAGKDG